MRLFKRNRGPASPEDMAVAARLDAVTNRGKVETSTYPLRDEPEKAQGPQRAFHMSDAASDESGRV
jgi:hypothetical protein